MKCQCEHASHFDDGTGHPYGEDRGADVAAVRTAYGTFGMCSECRTYHNPDTRHEA